MKLSKRLNAISCMITDGNSLADIGTDHGYIPVYRAMNGLCPGALAMDVAKGPLSRARENIARYGVGDLVETRLSDGLAGLGMGECESIVIAGMGGPLIIRILTADIDKAHAATELILSPHSEVENVRIFLFENGFKIIAEDIVKDEGKYYFILKAVPGTMEKPEGVTYLFGQYLSQNKNELMKEYLLSEKGLCEKIMDNLKANSDNETRIAEIKSRLNIIREALLNYENS